LTLTRKARHLPDLVDQVGRGTLAIWYVDKLHGNAITNYQVHESPTGIGAQSAAGFPRGYQITDSENHTDWRKRPGSPDRSRELKTLYESIYSGVGGSFEKGDPDTSDKYDVGGEFFTQKVTVRAANPSEQRIKGKHEETAYGYWAAEYRGPILAGILSGKSLPSVPQSNLEQLGATAISRCSPTNNIASSANMLRELRTEGLPKLSGLQLLKKKTNLLRNLGEEHLNVQFGWMPIVGDLKAVAFVIANAHTLLSQYERDAGRVVRRRYYFPEERTSSASVVGAQRALLGNFATGIFNPVNTGGDPLEILYYGGAGTSTLYRIRQTWKKAWFSGAFTYHLPSGYNPRNKMAESARHAQFLLGLDLTPEVVWNATPWTWAIDWFSNAGDVIANLSDWATDGLVMKYGYMMEHSIATDTYFVDKRGALSAPFASPSPLIVSVETKRRVKASPFGFGLTWSGLSLRQKAIAGALGLTKGIKH